MGAFTSSPNFGEKFSTGDRFVVTGMSYNGKIKTKYGEAESSMLTIVSREHPDRKVTYLALGVGIARQSSQAEPSDFPQVVELTETPTSTPGNSVKLLAPVDVDPRPFIEGDDGPPLVLTGVIEAMPADEEGNVGF